jgi:phosphoserine phosphatase RsbU/P
MSRQAKGERKFMICHEPNPVVPFANTELYGFPTRPRVLVAEDQDDVIAALHLLLKNNGYQVDFVKSPGQALEALRRQSFDAVLLDLNYSRDTTSGAEGLQLLSDVQALDQTLAVVVMTAWGSIELAVKAMHRGACDFVQKPWDNRQLLQVLQQQIQHSHDMRLKRLSEEQERQEAAEIQRALMPGEMAALEGFSLAASLRSARVVGGDYYDIIRVDENRTAICIADVVGKGVGAALLMSNLQAAVRMLSPELAAQPATLCERLNKLVFSNNVRGKFITFFYCVIDRERMKVTYTNAGHNWPILAHADGTIERLNSEDGVLGSVPGWFYHECEAGLRPGDRLVLFTDGITECIDESGDEFGEARLCSLVSQSVWQSATEIKDAVLTSTGDHCKEAPGDDATLIVLALQ